MRMGCRWLGAALVLTAAAPAPGGLVVTTYRTVAQTNGYAPVSQAQYFAEQRLENVSPAHAQVSGDWTGPNADGTPNTWHFVGTSRATSTTTITADSYAVEASASFAFELDTAANFADPASASVFAPGAVANYNGFFETDVPLVYAITVQLNQRGRVRLNQIGGPENFDENNLSVVPRLVNFAGTIPAGRYQILATTGSGVPNLPNGTNHRAASGGFESLVFSVRVPEPRVLGLSALVLAMETRRQRCRARGR